MTEPSPTPTPGGSFSGSPAASPPTRPARCSGACARPGTTSRSWRRVRAGVHRRGHVRGALGPPGARPACSRTSPRSSTSPSGACRPRRASSRRRPTCSPAWPTGAPTTCSPPRCSPRGARCCWSPRCTPRCGSTRRPSTTSPPLRPRGIVVLEPASGRLTGADSGRGRLPEPPEIAEFARLLLEWGPRRRCRATCARARAAWSSPPAAPASRSTPCARSATGRRAARATRWPASPPSAAPTSRWSPAHRRPRPARRCRARRGQTTREMRDAVLDAAKAADVVVMAAAVSDFRPATSAGQDQEGRRGAAPAPARVQPRHPARAGQGRGRPGQVVVGFAAETGDDAGSGARLRAGEARAQGLRPARRQRGGRRAGVRGRGQRGLAARVPTDRAELADGLEGAAGRARVGRRRRAVARSVRPTGAMLTIGVR